MTIFDLAYAHLIYQQMAKYDKSLNHLFSQTNRKIDLADSDHINELLIWLNKWGCRHISKASYDTLDIELKKWWRTNRKTVTATRKCNEHTAIIFDSLSNIVLSNNEKAIIHFGPTAAAKTLFVINPKVFIPWDIKIRALYSDSGDGYCKFLKHIDDLLKDIYRECERKNYSWDNIIKEYFPGYISNTKLIDEYLWVTKTNKYDLNKDKLKALLKI